MTVASLTAATALSLTAALGLGPWSAATAPLDTGYAPSGGWRWPLAGTPVVARPFQAPPHPWSAGHRGVDLAAPPGSSVLAAGSGVVSFAGYVAGVGVVAIMHGGGLRTTYEPVDPTVAAGDPVSAGDPIGRLLPGHGDCGPDRWCLHWGLLRGSVYLDPLTLIHRGPVRLLPLTAAPAWPFGRVTAVGAAGGGTAGAAGRAAPLAASPAPPGTAARPDAGTARSTLSSPASRQALAGAALTAGVAGVWTRRRARAALGRWLSRAGRRAWP